jgi:hypothetical protein
MNDQLIALGTRLEGLERQNRHYRRFGAALLALSLGLGTTAAVGPAICETVSAERFILTDASGHERMRLNAYGGDSASMQLFDANGRELSALAWNDGVRFEFKDREGAAGSTLRIDNDGRAYFEQRLGSTAPPATVPEPVPIGCGNVHGRPHAPTGCWEHVPVGEITGPR